MLENNGLAINRLNALGAALNLSFIGSEELNSRITFTRASGATRFNKNRLLEIVGNDVARFDYDPADGAPKGLLIEESRTNLLIQSENFTQASWIKTDITVAKTQTGLSGIANSACLITEGSAGTAGLAQGSGTIAAGATCSYSVVIRKNAVNDWIRIACASPGGKGYQAWFNISTGALGTTGVLGTGVGSASIQDLGQGYYACKVTATIGEADTVCNSNLYSTTANTVVTRAANAVYTISHAQLEIGAFPTSYIPTTASAVTRAADSAIISGTNFSSWYNQTQGTFVVAYDRFGFNAVGGSVAIVQADDNTLNNRLALRMTPMSSVTGAQGTIAVGGVVVANDVQIGVDLTNLIRKSGLAYLVGAGSVTSDGRVPMVLTSVASLPAVTQLGVGQTIGGGAAVLNGHIRSIAYYNTKLLDTQLQALTA